MISKMLRLIFPAIFLFLSSDLIAQNGTKNIFQCDSLSNDPQLILHFVENTTQNIEGLEIIRKRLGWINKLNHEQKIAHTNIRIPSNDYFAYNVAGPAAAQTFEFYRFYVNKLQIDSAAIFFELAIWLRNQFISLEVDRLRKTFLVAERAYCDHDFVTADSVISAFNREEQSLPAYKLIGDSLKPLFKKLTQSIVTSRNIIRDKELREKFGRYWRIALEVGVVSFPQTKKPGWSFYFDPVKVPRLEGYSLNGPSIPSSVVNQFAISSDYFILSHLTLGGRFRGGYIYKNVELTIHNEIPNSTFMLTEYYMSADAIVTLYFFRKVGFCPFASYGIGYLSINRKETKMTSPSSYFLPNEKKSTNSLESIIEIGTDYEFSENSPIHLIVVGNAYSLMKRKIFLLGLTIRLGITLL